MVRWYCPLFFERLIADPQPCLDFIIRQSRGLLENGFAGTADQMRRVAQLPDEAAIAIFAQEPLPIDEQSNTKVLFA